jgi:Fe-S cluster assembly iron-binding protein IscA
LKEGDSKMAVEGVEIIFNKQDKLYIHKSIVDYKSSNPGNGFEVIPWFQGFDQELTVC